MECIGSQIGVDDGDFRVPIGPKSTPGDDTLPSLLIKFSNDE